MAPTPTNSPTLISSIFTFSTARIVPFSARITFAFSPFVVLIMTVGPSTLTMVPARRWFCAKARDGSARTARVTRNLAQFSRCILPPWRRRPAHSKQQHRRAGIIPLSYYFSTLAPDFRSASTSARNSAVTCGRMPNQSEKPRTAWCNSIPSPSAVRMPVSCGREQRRFQRHIDDVGHHRAGRQVGDIDIELRLAGHAQRGGIHQQPGAGRNPLTSPQRTG